MLACPRCGSSYMREVVFCGLDGERLVPSEQDLLIGRTIDRYAIESVLGDGGMARVYRAKHVHLAQPFALKVLFGDMASDKTLAERFRREAQSAAQIKHPNVVAVTDFGVSGEGLSFMAMELLVGPTLSELRRQGPTALTPERIAGLMRQLVSGLGAAHALGFVHRDLKPKNVMVVTEGGAQLVKILDFGLVRTVDNGDARLTQRGQIFGTPAYMAPEQISEGEIDARTDLYALGAILYELLAGRPPFVGNMTDIFRKHLYETPARLTDTSGLGELAMVLLAKEKNARPRGSKEVLEILDSLGLKSDAMLFSIPPSLVQPAPKSAGRPSSLPPPAPAASTPPARQAKRKHSVAPLDEPLDNSISDDDQQIEKMAASAQPSLLRAAAVVVALGAVGYFTWRYSETAPTVEPPPIASVAPDAAVKVAPTPSPSASRAPAKKKRSTAEAAAAAAAAAAATAGATGSPLGAAGSTALSSIGELLDDDDSLDIPMAQFDGGTAPVEVLPPIETPPPVATPPPVETQAPTPSPDTPDFSDLDRELRAQLGRRALHILDLEAYEPEALDRWRGWRTKPAGDPRETYDTLVRAIALASADPAKLLASKRARIPVRLVKLDGSPKVDELSLELMALEARAKNTDAVTLLVAYHQLELEIDRLSEAR